jgi:hypothetical protein
MMKGRVVDPRKKKLTKPSETRERSVISSSLDTQKPSPLTNIRYTFDLPNRFNGLSQTYYSLNTFGLLDTSDLLQAYTLGPNIEVLET